LTFPFTPTTSFAEEFKKDDSLPLLYSVPDDRLKEAYREFLNKEEMFNFIDGLRVAVYPKLVPLKGVIYLKVHPQFITTVVFPDGFQIESAVASFKPKLLRARDNVLEVQPTKSFLEGNCVVYYRRSDGKRGVVQLILKNLNTLGEKFLYTQVALTGKKLLSPVEVVSLYRRAYGTLPQERVIFRVGGVPYLIKPERRFPNLFYQGKTFLVVPFRRE